MESNSSHPNRSSKKVFIALLMIALLLMSAVLVFLALESQKQIKKPASTSKEIPKLTVISFGAKNELYPASMETENAFALNHQLFEALVKYEDRTNIVPGLATSWTNPDELTWRFTLKKNVKFHTGRTMTADDVVYSYEQAKKNEYINNVYLNSIASIVAINPQQIEIKTSQPDPVLLNKLTFLMIIDAKGNGEVSPVYGTGAFTLKKGTKPSEDKIELVAFDDYHGGRVQTRELTLIRTDSDEQSTDLLLKGKGNIAGDFLPSNIPALDKKKMYRIPFTSYSTTFLAPVTNKPGPLQKQEVRKALQYSLDVPKIIEATGLSAKQSSQLVTSLIPGYNPAIPEVSQDIEKAKQLLSEAGYPNGVTLDFIYSPAAPSELIKEVIRQSALAGITLKGREVEGLEEMANQVGQSKTDLAYYAYGSDTFDSADVIDGVLFADNQYPSPSIQSRLAEASATVDTPKRLRLLKDIHQQIFDETAIIPLYSRNLTWYADKQYVLPQDTPNSELGVYFWKARFK